MSYAEFIESKSQMADGSGFEPLWMPDFLFDFQRALCDWSIRKGRAAMFANCGLGKTPMQLVWAENIVRKTNRPILLLTPLGVGAQTLREAAKFGIDAVRSYDGKISNKARVVIANYERLHLFDQAAVSGAVGDESSILKNFKGVLKARITEFVRLLKYRLLCTATAAPNDFIELGTSSECLGELGYIDMLGRFFKNDQNSLHPTSGRGRFETGLMTQNKWRFRGYAEKDFWRWVCSWARAVRKPSDLGFDDAGFKLPPLDTQEHVIKSNKLRPGMLLALEAKGLKEQRQERRITLNERCEKVAEILGNTGKPAIAWCHLNPEGDLLEKLIPGAVQVSGHSDTDEEAEEKFEAFIAGQIRVLVSKPVLCGFGLNFQHCAHQTFFPSHSFEQYYQAVRRCWRFGQKQSVKVDMVTSEGEIGVLANLKRKADQAEIMFARLVEMMNDQLKVSKSREFTVKEAVPTWL